MTNRIKTLLVSTLALFFVQNNVVAQAKPAIDKEFVTQIIIELASDKMEGRKIFSPGLEKASQYIETEFQKIGLDFYDGLSNYRQEFLTDQKATNNVIGVLKGKSKPNEIVVFSAHFDHLGMKNAGDDKILTVPTTMLRELRP